LEHALSRAGVPAWFDRGTRRPHPAGRAFVAMLACACEKLSARRFAEYLSLAQVPQLDETGSAPAFIAPDEEELSLPGSGLRDAEREHESESADDKAARSVLSPDPSSGIPHSVDNDDSDDD